MDGEVGVYVSNGVELHRYVLTATSPCTLDRDPKFGASGKSSARGEFAIGPSGEVWLSDIARVARAFPAPTRKCTMDPGYFDEDGLPFYDPGVVDFDDDGRTGWVHGGHPGTIGRFTAETDACSVAIVESPFAFPLRGNTPRDALGRLHILDAPSPGLVGIYTADGTPVSSYFAKANATDPDAFDVTRCAGGVCVLGKSAAGFTLTYATDDGVARGTLPVIKHLDPRRIAADRTGPVFFAGPTDPSIEAEYMVAVQLAPELP